MKNFKLVKKLVCILGVLMLTACSAQSNIESEQVEEEEKVYSPTQASIAETSPTPTPTQTPAPEPTPIPKGDILERSYPSHRDFPYGEMEFVDDQTYAFLKEIYDGIDFYGEFELGEAGLYDEYIAQYKKLVENEITFTVTETGQEYYLCEYEALSVYGDEVFNPHEFVYYLFDMDGDNAPELCIWNFATYIFKYDIETEKIILWSSLESYYECIHATKMIRWDWEGVRHTFCKLDEAGDIEFGVYFMEESSWSNGKETFMVTIPTYLDEDKQIDIPYVMKEQAYYNEEDGLYYFNITGEQYEELTKDYFESSDSAKENIKKLGYTYDDLLGGGTVCETCSRIKDLYLSNTQQYQNEE